MEAGLRDAKLLPVCATLRSFNLFTYGGSVYALVSQIDSRSRLTFENILLRASNTALYRHSLADISRLS
jgi:hypothetical protein